MNARFAAVEQEGEGAQTHAPSNAGDAFRQWLATEEGGQLWGSCCAQISTEVVCHALTHTRATRFGLLLTATGAVIWSRFSSTSFKRLAPKYEQSATTGLCFWWDGHVFHRLGGAASLARIQTLPTPPTAGPCLAASHDTRRDAYPR